MNGEPFVGHKLEVPPGWRRGEPLTSFEGSGNFCLRLAISAEEGLRRLREFDAALIWFSSAEKRQEFLEWWHAPQE